MLELGVLQGSGGFRSGKEKSRAVMCIVWYKGLRGLHRQMRGFTRLGRHVRGWRKALEGSRESLASVRPEGWAETGGGKATVRQ